MRTIFSKTFLKFSNIVAYLDNISANLLVPKIPNFFTPCECRAFSVKQRINSPFQELQLEVYLDLDIFCYSTVIMISTVLTLCIMVSVKNAHVYVAMGV